LELTEQTLSETPAEFSLILSVLLRDKYNSYFSVLTIRPLEIAETAVAKENHALTTKHQVSNQKYEVKCWFIAGI